MLSYHNGFLFFSHVAPPMPKDSIHDPEAASVEAWYREARGATAWPSYQPT